MPQRYKAPVRPGAVGGALPFNGPYQQQMMHATQAYQNALAQVNNQRNSTLQSYGYQSGPGGSLSVNTGNPYGAYNVMQEGLDQNRDQFQQGFNQMYGDTAEANSQEGAGAGQIDMQRRQQEGVREDFASKLAASLTPYNQMNRAALVDYNQSKLGARSDLINYLQSHQQFSKGHAMRSQHDFDARIKALSAAWSNRWGVNPGSKNKTGLTFQQKLDSYGTKLWDPSFHTKVAGVRF